ncbi:MAG: hypothetical protein V1487_00650 [bacterium]
MKKTKLAKISPWMKLYRFALGGIVVMTVMAVAAMVWQYYDLQSKVWMFSEYESDDLMVSDIEINLIDAPKARDGGLSVCGSTNETKGECKTMQLSTPTSGGSCQAQRKIVPQELLDKCNAENGTNITAVTEKGCRATAASMFSWAGAFRTCNCQPGLIYDQRTITSSFSVADPTHTTGTAVPKGHINVDGMHKCAPGLAGRYCPAGGERLGKNTQWVPCVTAPYKGACKYGIEEVVRVISGGKQYLFCAPTNQPGVDDGTSCYTGNASKPTVKICCPVGQKVVSGKCQ